MIEFLLPVRDQRKAKSFQLLPEEAFALLVFQDKIGAWLEWYLQVTCRLSFFVQSLLVSSGFAEAC
jgi:hypothetical protein